jgi:hypothetical protein
MRILTALAFSATVLMAQSAQAQDRVPMIPDAREQTPAALLGLWKVDGAASTPASTARSQLRSFSLTADGKLMVAFLTIRADGSQSFGHWSLQVDGSPGSEYRSDNRSVPVAEIRFKKVDETTLNLSNTVAGEVKATSVWKLSDNGATLTATRTPRGGATTVTVYKKWDGR